MRNALYTSEQELFLAEAQKFHMESEFSQLKTFIAQSDYKSNPVPPLIEAFLPSDAGDFDQSYAGIQVANALFEEPLNFYGGYIMMAMHKKRDIM